MNIDLLKKVAQYTLANMKTPTQINGYTNEEVGKAVEELLKNGVITWGMAIKYSPANGNYTTKLGKSIPLGEGEKMSVANVSEHAFEKNYGKKIFG